MSASNKFINVVLIGGLGILGLGLSLYLLLGSDRVVSAVYHTGLDKLEAGDLESAKIAFERALERSEDKAPAAYQLALLAGRENAAESIPYIKTAIEQGNPDGKMLAGMVPLAIRAEDVSLAQDLIVRLQKVDPANANILPLRGQLAIAQHRYADAISLFEELLGSGSATDDVKFALGQLLVRSANPLERTRAKVILKDAAEGQGTAARNALLFIFASAAVEMDARDWKELFQLGAEKGFLSWPVVEENLPLLRRLSALASLYAHEFAPEIAEKRAEHPDASTPDFVDAAFMAQQNRRLRRSNQLLDMVPESEQESYGVRLLRANQLILEGRPDTGVEQLEEVIKASPDERSALALLRELAKAPEGTFSVREQISVLTMLAEHTYATLEDRFAAYDRILELRPLAAREILEKVATEVGRDAPQAVANWLIGRGEPSYVEELVTEDLARSNPNLFELRLIAFIQQGKLDEAEAMLSNRPANLPSILVTTGRLRIAMAREDTASAREIWEEALAAADGQGLVAYVPLLGQMALKFGAEDLAARAYQLAFERGAPMAERDWLELTDLVSTEPLAKQLSVSEAAQRAYPANPIFLNNVAYLQLLEDEDVRENLVRVEDLVDDHPDIDYFRVTLGLAYLKNDRATMAVRTLEPLEMIWTPDGASALAVYLAALSQGDRRTMAENIARDIDTSKLLPEERDLIASLLK